MKAYGKIINKKPCLIIGTEIIPIIDYIKSHKEKETKGNGKKSSM